MSYLLRIFWLIAISIFVSGCSGYRVACFPTSDGSLMAGQDGEEICNLKPGDNVLVILVDGEQAEGVIQVISPSEIVLDAKGKNLQPRGYSMDQIYSIEEGATATGSTAAVSTATDSTTKAIIIAGVFALVIGGVILANSMSGLNNMYGK